MVKEGARCAGDETSRHFELECYAPLNGPQHLSLGGDDLHS